ncbi:VanZ family protein [Sediminibacillus halophilus]|uniref:VanZ like family protein n=1 Tax=Sediminibacillus halophilus TaxID=482461 RepID=A0A1G9NLE0_9BACI|nr:VanZ family protein [Sediminibacillus halophilus]SDL87174.1 VanZ like family protein [Sediminibacillus halophilus]
MEKRFVISLWVSQIVFVLLLPIWITLTEYLHSLVLIVVWVCYSFAFFSISSIAFKKRFKIAKKSLNVCIIVYSIFLLVLLFFRPAGPVYDNYNIIPFKTIMFYLDGETSPFISFYNLAANIGLFIPFGIYYCCKREEAKLTYLVGMAIASVCLVEILQFLTHRGSMDIDDLILNTSGILLGYLIYPLFRKVFSIVH